MDFFTRLALLFCAVVITWYVNYEKNRYSKLLAHAYDQKAERRIGELSEVQSRYSNFLGLMGFVDLFLLVNLIADPFF